MRHLWAFLLLTSCSGPSIEYRAVEMNGSIPAGTIAESIIAPYRDSLQQTMGIVLVQNSEPLSRGIPESALGNLIADLLLEKARTEMPDTLLPDLCLINIGGLRVDLPQGDITVGKVFELMPFENELDILRLSPEKMKGMFDYLREKGGQPIAGMRLTIKGDGYECAINDRPWEDDRTYYIVTSDYLADGGDRMDFFLDPMERIGTGIKIRDAIIDHFRTVGLAGETLTSQLDGRLAIE